MLVVFLDAADEQTLEVRANSYTRSGFIGEGSDLGQLVRTGLGGS